MYLDKSHKWVMEGVQYKDKLMYKVSAPQHQGLTLFYFSAQLGRFLWDRGAFRGCFGGV